MVYDPEQDTSPELDPDTASYYLIIIHILSWMIEQGRINMITQVSLLSSHVALPRERHLEAAIHVPEPQGKQVDICMFVDSNHAGDKVSCRSRSGFLINGDNTLVQWFSKKQSTGETSVFGAKFVTMKQGIDALRGLRYKLRMMDVSISSPLSIYGDNMSVVHDTSKPESALRKKSNSVCQHTVHESIAMGGFLVGHIPSKKNVADLMTNILHGQKRRYLVRNIIYDVYDDHQLSAQPDNLIPLVIASNLRGQE